MTHQNLILEHLINIVFFRVWDSILGSLGSFCWGAPGGYRGGAGRTQVLADVHSSKHTSVLLIQIYHEGSIHPTSPKYDSQTGNVGTIQYAFQLCMAFWKFLRCQTILRQEDKHQHQQTPTSSPQNVTILNAILQINSMSASVS